jgi:hypothetical protein
MAFEDNMKPLQVLDLPLLAPVQLPEIKVNCPYEFGV